MQRVPRGVLLTIALFTFGAFASGIGGLALAFPESVLRHLWRINPEGHRALSSMGLPAFILMATLCIACSVAAVGLVRQAWWGHRVAVAILAINVIGDITNAVLRDDLRTLIGVPIGLGFIAYLLAPKVKEHYRRS